MGRRACISESSLAWVAGQEDVDTASWRAWAVGVDCASKFHAVCVLIPDYAGNVVRRIQRRIDAKYSALVEAKQWVLAQLRRYGHQPDRFSYCLESTACYHMPVVHAWAGDVCIVNPTLVGAGRRKTDKLDALTLAKYHLTGFWPVSYWPSTSVLELRVLDRARRTAQRNAHRALMSIGANLLTFGYTFTAWQSLAHEEVRPHVEDLCDGKGPLLSQAREHCSAVPLPATTAAIIRQAYRTYDTWRERANLLERDLIGKVKGLDWPTLAGGRPGKEVVKVLDSIPGVGELTAAVWLIQSGDPGRFLTAKQVAAYCGFDPSLKVSADKVTAHVRRKGNKVLHKVLIQAAQSVIRRAGEPLGWWGRKLAQRGKGAYQRAVGAVGRRIAVALWVCQGRVENWSSEGYASLQGVTPCQDERRKGAPPPSPHPGQPGCSSGG